MNMIDMLCCSRDVKSDNSSLEDRLRAWGVKPGDSWPEIYIKRGWWIRPIRLGTAKIDDANINGRLPSSCDLTTIAAHRLHLPGCGWSLDCTRSGVIALDIEERIFQGQDGLVELRRLGERLGLTESMIPLGQTPIYRTRSGGLRVLYASPGHPVRSGLLQGCKYVEIKAHNSSVRLPPGGGYGWDPISPFPLPLIPLPAWLTTLPVLTIRAHEALLPEGELGERDHTVLGGRMAERIAKAAEASTSTPEACRRAAALGHLVAEGKISTEFGERIVAYLGEKLPDFTESGFNHGRLQHALRRSFTSAYHG